MSTEHAPKPTQVLQTYFSGKTVLVTGAAGFLGSHLCETLLDLDANVVGVDSFITGREQNIAHLDSSAFRFIEADARVPVEQYLPTDVRPDVILHFASPASPPQYQKHPIETYQVNAWGTHELLSYIHEYNHTARMVFASTSEVYGDPAEHPQPESYWGNVNPNGARSCYDESKRLGESICGVFHREFGVDVRIVRIFNTYGPRIHPADGRVIPNFVRQALAGESLTIYGDGTQTRSYCFVSDLVDGILRLAATEGLAGETLNLGNPDERTTLETAEVIAELTGNTHAFEYLPLPSDDPTRRQPDISRAKKLLGWEPKVSFEDGVRDTIEYFRQHELKT